MSGGIQEYEQPCGNLSFDAWALHVKVELDTIDSSQKMHLQARWLSVRKEGAGEGLVLTMTLLCISSVATSWPAARSLLVMITFAPAAASTLTVSLPIPTVISTKFDFDVQVTIADRTGHDGCTSREFSAKVMFFGMLVSHCDWQRQQLYRGAGLG